MHAARIVTALWSSSLALFALAACSGGGGGGGGTSGSAIGNLENTSLRTPTNDPNAAHEIELLVGIDATRDYDAVPVAFELLNKADVDAGVEEPRQFSVQDAVFTDVKAGAGEYRAIVVLPQEVDPAGEYLLVVRVDPLDQLVETDESDNATDIANAPVTVTIGRAWTETPDIVLEDVLIDAEAIVLNALQQFQSLGAVTDVENHHFGATVMVTTTGANALRELDLSVAFDVPGQGFQDLMIWERQNDRYVPSYLVDEVVPGEPNSIHLDVFIPESVRVQLLDLVQNGPATIPMRVSTNMTAGIGEWELGSRRFNRPDNGVVFDVVIVGPSDPIQQGGLHWSAGFDKTWSNSVFGVGIGLSSEASVDERGAIAQARAEVPVQLIGAESRLFDCRIYGRSDPDVAANSRFSIDVEVLGSTVFARAIENPRYVNTERWTITETATARSLFWVGPVPLTTTAGSTGVLGFEETVDIDTSRIILTAHPFAEASAFAEARVDLAVVAGGVRGDLLLVRDDFTATAVADLAIVNNGNTLLGTLTFDVVNALQGPRGHVYLYADYPVVKWCKVLGVPVPCGVRTKRAKKTLTKFASFVKEDVLLREQASTQVDLTQS